MPACRRYTTLPLISQYKRSFILGALARGITHAEEIVFLILQAEDDANLFQTELCYQSPDNMK